MNVFIMNVNAVLQLELFEQHVKRKTGNDPLGVLNACVVKFAVEEQCVCVCAHV